MAKEGGKPKRKPRKKKTDAMGLSAIDSEQAVKKILPEKKLAEVEEVIKQAFLRFYDSAQLKQHRVKDLEHLDGIVAEFLKAFMILGYDLNGEKVVIMHATNHQEKDALIEHLRTTLLGFINPNS